MEESYINKEGLEAFIKAGTTKKVVDMVELTLDGFIGLLETGVSPRAAKEIYMALLEGSIEQAEL